MKIELVSKQFHKFAGRIHKKGEHLFATPAEARILKALGRANPDDAATAPAEAEAKAKRAYKKRAAAVPAEASTAVPAMATVEPVAEPVAELAPAVAAPVPASLVDEVTKVKDEFRRRLFPERAPDVPRETLTRPKAKTQE
jgi:hypothetical protein